VRRFLCFSLFTMLAVVVSAQQIALKADPSAEILQRMAAATGWNATSTPSSLAIAGTTTFESSEDRSSSPFSVRATSTGKFAHEYTSSSGKKARLVVGDSGNAISRDTKQRSLPPHAVMAMAKAFFPFYGAMGNVERGDLRSEYVGLDTVNSRATYQIRLNYVVRDPNSANEVLQAKLNAIVVWIDTATFLPVQIEYKHYASTNLSAYMVRRRLYSDFRKVGEVLFPHRQEETNEGVRIVYEVSAVEINPPLQSSDFTLTQGGR